MKVNQTGSGRHHDRRLKRLRTRHAELGAAMAEWLEEYAGLLEEEEEMDDE